MFSATPSGAGGVAFCTGADNYQFNYNWVCGNMSTGDGAGVSHLGFIWNGNIQHNTILFNQSDQPDDAQQRRRPAHHERSGYGSDLSR